MKFGKFIKPGDTIAIAAPSFGASIEPYITRFSYAVKKLEQMGYKIKAGDCCHKNDGLGISTDPQTAAKELEDFFLDDSIDAIISCGGGELMCEVMSFIDFDRIAQAKPKWFMGYSDNTNFIHPLVTMCDIAAIYGPCITGLAKPWEQCEEDVWNLITGQNLTVKGYSSFQNPSSDTGEPLAKYILDEPKILSSFIPKNDTLVKAEEDEKISFSGTLLGGCLDILDIHCGTRFDRVKQFNEVHNNVIWVLEACDLMPMDIRRSLWHLNESGWFDNAKGFIIGRPLASFRQMMMGVDQYNAVTDILKHFNVPVIMDADVGHIDPAMPLIMGSSAIVDVKGNDITVKMELK